MSHRLSALAAIVLTSGLLLTGCAAAPTATAPDGSASEPAQALPDPIEAAEPEPVEQEETCDWGSARMDSASSDGVPSAPGQGLETALIGAWQHTHIDSGAGYEALASTTDIRYVFPSTTRLLYCQDVAGATSQAENAVDIELSGSSIVLPSPATGYEVSAWSADTMVWVNNRDGSLYLLKRR